ncbi:hypothetical protein AMJ86_04995 [bacterium SM23_57]|nr:MAG: hypothetical protein AMJ86_04995 [bacterium SM23_57]
MLQRLKQSEDAGINVDHLIAFDLGKSSPLEAYQPIFHLIKFSCDFFEDVFSMGFWDFVAYILKEIRLIFQVNLGCLEHLIDGECELIFEHI